MPGLFGIMAKSNRVNRKGLLAMGQKMALVLRSQPWLRQDMFLSDHFCGGIVDLGVFDSNPERLTDAATVTWVSGEIYGDGSAARCPDAGESHRILSGDDERLKALDGQFAIACYDTHERTLALVNDRLGLRPLYVVETDAFFAFAGEVKALLIILPGLPDIDEIGLRQYLAFGYMLGDRTWWKGVTVHPPGAICTVRDGVPVTRRYWTFADMEGDRIDQQDLFPEWKRRWSRSVAQRSKPGLTPLLLSGGLDSRCLMAELVEQGRDIATFTWGSAGASDLRIAARAAAVAGVPHTAIVNDERSWWYGREEGVWQIDGMISVFHLQACAGRDELRIGNRCAPMNLAGDLLFGGSYLEACLLDRWPHSPSALMSAKYEDNPFVSRDEALDCSKEDIEAYAEGPSPDCFYLLQRVRRFTINGPVCVSAYYESSYPSLSHGLLELLLGRCDDRRRLDGRLYEQFLLNYYPAYYGDIPSQKTGRGFHERFHTRVFRDIRQSADRLMPRGLGGWRLREALRLPLASRDDHEEVLQKSPVLENGLKGDLLVDELLGGAASKWLAERTGSAEIRTRCKLLTMEWYLRQVGNAGFHPVGSAPAPDTSSEGVRC